MHEKLEIEMNVFKSQEQLHFHIVFIIRDVYFSAITNITYDHNPVGGLPVPKHALQLFQRRLSPFT